MMLYLNISDIAIITVKDVDCIIHGINKSALSWVNDSRTWRKKKHLVVDDFMLDKVLDKIKEIIGIE